MSEALKEKFKGAMADLDGKIDGAELEFRNLKESSIDRKDPVFVRDQSILKTLKMCRQIFNAVGRCERCLAGEQYDECAVCKNMSNDEVREELANEV